MLGSTGVAPAVNTLSAPSSELLLQHLANIQLTVNENDIVLTAHVNGPSSALLADDMIGRSLHDLVEAQNHATLQSRLVEARTHADTAVRCDLSVKPRGGSGVPVLCWMCADAASQEVRIAAIDLLPEASLRHQLINAQHAMERDYWSKRRLEAEAITSIAPVKLFNKVMTPVGFGSSKSSVSSSSKEGTHLLSIEFACSCNARFTVM